MRRFCPWWEGTNLLEESFYFLLSLIGAKRRCLDFSCWQSTHMDDIPSRVFFVSTIACVFIVVSLAFMRRQRLYIMFVENLSVEAVDVYLFKRIYAIFYYTAYGAAQFPFWYLQSSFSILFYVVILQRCFQFPFVCNCIVQLCRLIYSGLRE